MADKFLSRNEISGFVQENNPVITSTGAPDANRIVATDSDGRISLTVLPVGVVPDTQALPAFETLSAGDYVYIRLDGGVPKAAKASADVGGTQTCGFILAGGSTGATVLVYFEGRNTAMTGLTPGSRYYLSDTTPGGVTSTPVTGSGKLHQFIGLATSSTTMTFEADDGIRLV